MGWYFLQVLIAIDQLGNALIGGWADETISSRSYRLSKKDYWWAGIPQGIINFIFAWEPNHCFHAYESERKGRQHHPELRNYDGSKKH